MDKEKINKLSKTTLDISIEIHKQLGPGLLISIYEICFCKELNLRNIKFKRQVEIPVYYKGEKLSTSFRIDILVENEIIIELKAIENILPVHKSQLLTYLKLTKKRLGLLINFNVPYMVEGFHRIVNKL
ncbi:MAG: GxxExxY protein [Ignavibacteria bacterium]|nr:GxxExxY protein [Ignavibacteria bacterium]